MRQEYIDKEQLELLRLKSFLLQVKELKRLKGLSDSAYNEISGKLSEMIYDSERSIKEYERQIRDWR